MNDMTIKPPCSIERRSDGRVVVVDHRHGDREIVPKCGVDALAYFNFVAGSLKFGATTAARMERAMEFLVEIADGKMPVTELIESAAGTSERVAPRPSPAK